MGSEICRLLCAERESVRALVRSTSDPAKVDQLKSLGAQIVLGDLRDRASLEAACQKVNSIITTLDVARFAEASLDHPAARNVTWQLGGPQDLSPLGVVRIFESSTGKPFEVVRVPVEALQAQFAAASDEIQKSFTGLMLTYANGVTIDMMDLLKLFQFKLKSVAEYARNVMA